MTYFKESGAVLRGSKCTYEYIEPERFGMKLYGKRINGMAVNLYLV